MRYSVFKKNYARFFSPVDHDAVFAIWLVYIFNKDTEKWDYHLTMVLPHTMIGIFNEEEL